MWVQSLGWEDILEKDDNSFQYSCLGNPRDRGAWWAIVSEVTKESSIKTRQEVIVTSFSVGRWNAGWAWDNVTGNTFKIPCVCVCVCVCAHTCTHVLACKHVCVCINISMYVNFGNYLSFSIKQRQLNTFLCFPKEVIWKIILDSWLESIIR